ncbi:MAG TPA: host specificity factor TipJ family phage tail protein, partial [Kaistia sp.]|nr:host specificity factor TipJ family phage tail protein [Kaistia sp.]
MIESSRLPGSPVAERDIRLVVVYNPFDVSDRTVARLAWEPGRTLSAYLDGLPDGVDWVVSVNGGPVEPEAWPVTTLLPDDSLAIVPIPRGGGEGGSKNVLRLVAMLAVSIAAPYLGTQLALAAGFVEGAAGFTTAVSMFTAGVGMAGSMLVNAILPPAMGRMHESGFNTEQESPTYGIDGAKNTSTEDVPVPVVYGEFRTAGNVINRSIVNDGDTQYLLMQVALSEGEIEDVSDIEINDQPLANFTDVDVVWRNGAASQDPIGWFAQTVVPVHRGAAIGTEWLTHRTTQAIDAVRFDVVFPQGLCVVDSQTGAKTEKSVTFEMRAVNVGTGTVHDLGSHHLTGRQRNPLRRSISPAVEFPQGVYDIQIRRTTAESTEELQPDQVQLTDVNEIVTDPVAYVHTAVVGIRIKLTDQLNGIPGVTFRVKGVKVWDYDAAGNPTDHAWSANPALIALDLLTNGSHGARLALSRLDVQRFLELRDRCTAKGYEFNGVFDFSSNVWDAVRTVLRTGQAQLISSGMRYSLAIDMADEPVMMFGMGNIVEGSFSTSWLGMEERANEVELSYYDRDDNWRRNTVRVVDDAAYLRGEPQRPTSVTEFGITSHEIAWLSANRMLAHNRAIRQTVEWEAPVEAIACTLGDVVLVQHDMPRWGEAGRVAPGSAATRLLLDKPVAMEAGKTYKALLLHAAVHRGQRQVRTVAGRSVLVDTLGGGRVKRARFAGRDVAVMSHSPGAPYDTLILEDAAGLAVGSLLDLWDTDVIEERLARVIAGETTELLFDDAFSITPDEYANWMFGEVGKVAKPFRITGIGFGNDQVRRLKAAEYNASVYEDPLNAVPTPNYSALTVGVPHCQVRQVVEEALGDGSRVRLTLFWNVPANIPYAGADVYVGRNDEPLAYAGAARNGAASFMVEAAASETYRIKLVTVDVAGRKARFEQAPVHTHGVQDDLAARPLPVSGIRARPFLITGGRGGVGLTLSWEHVGFVAGETRFEAWYSLDGSPYFHLGRTDDLFVSLWNAGSGSYQFKIIAHDRYGRPSEPALHGYVLDVSDFVALSSVSHLELFGSGHGTEFAGRDAKLVWRGNFPMGSYTWGEEPHGAGSGGIDQWFRTYVVRVFDADTHELRRVEHTAVETYTYTLEMNVEDGRRRLPVEGPARRLRVEVAIRDMLGRETVPARLTIGNPAPAAPLAVSAAATFNTVLVTYGREPDLDWAGAKVWMSASPGFTPGPDTLVYQGDDSLVSIVRLADGSPVAESTTYHYRIGLYDTFGTDTPNVSPEASVTTGILAVDELTGDIRDELDHLLGQIALKVDANGRISGFGLASSGPGDAPVSNFVVVADRLAVIQPGAGPGDEPTIPFAVGTVDGQSVVAIRKGMIQDASIGDAQISNLSADKITTGTLLAATSIKVGGEEFVLSGDGTLKVWDRQPTPRLRVDIGRLGPGQADYGINIRDHNGALVFGSAGFGSDVIPASALQGIPLAKVTGTGAFAGLDQVTAANVSTYIAAGAIGTAHIGDATISSAKIGAAAITTAKMQDGAITSAKIGNAQITNAKIGLAEVDRARVAGEAITIVRSASNTNAVTLSAVSTSGTVVQQQVFTSLTVSVPEAGSPVILTIYAWQGNTRNNKLRVLTGSGTSCSGDN